MIRRFYVHNFRCLQNFELPVAGMPSALLIGENGSGKSTVGLALEVLRKIGRGTTRVGELVKPSDFWFGTSGAPMRFEIEIELDGVVYGYAIVFELPERFKELRVYSESLLINGSPAYKREVSVMDVGGTQNFPIYHHLVALPIVDFESSGRKLISPFKQWLARMLILQPAPGSIQGESSGETLEPNLEVTNFGEWFSGVLALAPSAYRTIDAYLREIMPDFQDLQNPPTGSGSRALVVRFTNADGTVKVPFGALSDGEKCFMISALVLAANQAYGPLLCFWDEPDNYLAPSEVQPFVRALRREFLSRGQFVGTSHNPEAIRRFSDETTLHLSRRSHFEPTIVRRLEELHVNGDLVGALIRGDVEP